MGCWASYLHIVTSSSATWVCLLFKSSTFLLCLNPECDAHSLLISLKLSLCCKRVSSPSTTWAWTYKVNRTLPLTAKKFRSSLHHNFSKAYWDYRAKVTEPISQKNKQAKNFSSENLQQKTNLQQTRNKNPSDTNKDFLLWSKITQKSQKMFKKLQQSFRTKMTRRLIFFQNGVSFFSLRVEDKSPESKISLKVTPN